MGFFNSLFGIDKETHRDIQNYTLVDEVGREIGRVEDILFDEDDAEARYAIVDVDSRRVLVPVGELVIDDNARRASAPGYSRERLMQLKSYEAGRWNERAEREHYRDFVPGWKEGERLDYSGKPFRGQVPQRIQLIEEKLRIGKQRRMIGEATVTKRPVTETVSEQVQLETERLNVERRRVDRPVEGGATISDQPETIRVQLYGEEPVVEKRPMVSEEIEINKVTDTRTETVRDTVRHEELETKGVEKRDRDRQLSFSSSELSEAELAERERLERERRNRDDERMF